MSARLRLAGAAVLLAAQASCIELGRLDVALLADAAFPAAVPGLPADRTWTSLPLGTWIADGDLAVQALSACLAPDCAPVAAVTILRARGSRAGELARILDDPSRLQSDLAGRFRSRRFRPGRVPPETTVAVERRRTGFAVRLARTDGTRPAFGHVLARRERGQLGIVVVIAADAAEAERLAGAVVSHLGPSGA